MPILPRAPAIARPPATLADYATGNTAPGVSVGIGRVIVLTGVDHNRGAARMENGVGLDCIGAPHAARQDGTGSEGRRAAEKRTPGLRLGHHVLYLWPVGFAVSLGIGVMFTVTVYFLQHSLLEEVRLTAPAHFGTVATLTVGGANNHLQLDS